MQQKNTGKPWEW